MRNKKVILLSGFSRGGTNIVWNILQSHPQICSARYETGDILRKRNPIILSRQVSILSRLGLINRITTRKYLDYKFHRLKMSNMHHPDNKYKTEGVTYSKNELINCAICFKSVDFDINHTDLLLNLYPDLYFIALTRNGYALADGHIRRGSKAEEFAELYDTIASKMEYYSKAVKNFKLIKFEDVLSQPFKIAEELYEFTNSSPTKLDKLRLKSKRIVGKEGDHKVSFGKEHRKYWFDKSSIYNLLDPSINTKQRKNLSKDDISIFNDKANSSLRFFGYDIRSII